MTPDALIVSAAAAAAAGLMGCFAVAKRMTLAGDALSHVALPGVGIALMLRADPLIGAVVALAFGALLVWTLQDDARIATETIVGVIFSAALAIGSMLTSREDLIDALLGHPGRLALLDIVFGLTMSTAVVIFVLAERRRLIVAIVSPDIARTAGINVRGLELVFLEMFAMTVALGLRYLGVLLMGSLIIIPAATAKRLCSNVNQMLVTAATIAVAVTLVGSIVAVPLQRESGPVIVTLAAGIFFLSFLRRGDRARA